MGTRLTLTMLNKVAMPTFNFQPIRLLDQGFLHKFTYLMTNSADPDQLASSVSKDKSQAKFVADNIQLTGFALPIAIVAICAEK